MLIALLCAIIMPFIASAENGPTCVHVDGVEVAINKDQTQIIFKNHTNQDLTIDWQVWSNDPNYNPKIIASGTTYVPARTDGVARADISVPSGWSGAWLEHCKQQ